jgi:hypothetical protein
MSTRDLYAYEHVELVRRLLHPPLWKRVVYRVIWWMRGER